MCLCSTLVLQIQDFFEPVSAGACCPSVGFHQRDHVAGAFDVAHCFVDHTVGTVLFVRVDVQVDFNVPVFKNVVQLLIEFGDLVDFGHKTHARTILLVVVIWFALHFTEDLATMLTIDVHHDGQSVVHDLLIVDADSLTVAANVNACFWALCQNELSNFVDVDGFSHVITYYVEHGEGFELPVTYTFH